jgi:hypothetical protein
VRTAVGIVLAGIIFAASPAHAGRRDHAWLHGTEVMPERIVELEGWVFERRGLFDAIDDTWIAWQPLVGVTDRLELALPVEIIVPRTTDGMDLPNEVRYGAELRYRLVTADPVEAPPFVPLIRVGAQHGGSDNSGRFDVGAVVSYTAGRVRATVDVGLVYALRRGEDAYALRPYAGISIRAVGDLRLGVEALADIDLKDTDRKWFAVGPDLAWTHGRIWISAAAPIGLDNIEVAPRIGWGIAF